MISSTGLKGLLGCIGTIGVACAVGIPLLKSSILSDSMDRSGNVGDQIQNCETLRLNKISISDMPQLTFEELGMRINSNLNKECKKSFLPGKESFRQILESSHTNPKGKVHEEGGGECLKKSTCGYLFLESSSKTAQYKVNISQNYELSTGKSEGKIVVIKKGMKDGSISYGEEKPINVDRAGGQELNRVEWNNFMFNKDSNLNNEWSKIGGFSIQKTI